MAKRVVKIANCRSASIRRAPWIPLRDREIVGMRDGPTATDSVIKAGQTVTIDTDDICYDWKDRKFYKTISPKGWIYEGCIDLGDNNGGQS